MSDAQEIVERRKRQRFLASRGETPHFRVVIGGERLPLLDLSLEGFAMPAATPPAAGKPFEFAMICDGEPGEVRGRATVVNYVARTEGGQAGCLFDAFDGDGAVRLQRWLEAHVIDGAWMPITEDDAESIVTGPSLI